jgi:hypothetical protein
MKVHVVNYLEARGINPARDNPVLPSTYKIFRMIRETI